jgi:hypothetical protein
MFPHVWDQSFLIESSIDWVKDGEGKIYRKPFYPQTLLGQAFAASKDSSKIHKSGC